MPKTRLLINVPCCDFSVKCFETEWRADYLSNRQIDGLDDVAFLLLKELGQPKRLRKGAALTFSTSPREVNGRLFS